MAKLFSPIYPEDCKETYQEILECNCEHQICKGKFIKTRDGQLTCLWDYLKNYG